MNAPRRPALLLLGAATILLLSACVNSSAGPEPSRPGDSTTTTTLGGTTTSTLAPTSTTAAPTTTSTTVAATTTTKPSSVLDEAEGSGCTPGAGDLPDGDWFGYVLTTDENELGFDLACWFTGDAAARAAAEDGEESPPPNDYYIRNVNELIRTLAVAADAEVMWFPDFGDPTSETTVPYSDWIDLSETRDFMPGVWLEIDGGEVVSIQEQWVP